MSVDLEARADAEDGGVFAAPLRGFTIGILTSVGVIAFESLGVATILPTAARSLGGLGTYGWGLSALMLANIVGTVIAGSSIDRSGPFRAVLLGSLVFAAGTLLAGFAPSWGMFIAARAIQGLGVGTIMASAYSLVGLMYPARLQGLMFAFLSSAWTIPSLVGPILAGAISSWLTWRVVFWAIAPMTILLLPFVAPRARSIAGPAERATARRPILYAVAIAAGTSLFLIGLEATAWLAATALTLIGLTGAILALRMVVPPGTLRVNRGMPAGIVIRFLLCAVYFGSEAFLPLGLADIHRVSVTVAGIGLAAGALAWTAGSFVQARIEAKNPGHQSAAVTAGFAVLLTGEIIMGGSVALAGAWAGWAVVGWTIGGIGMGIAFNAATSATMAQAPTELTGTVSANLQLAQTLATALMAGIGGAIVAGIGATTAGFLSVFGITAILGLTGTLLGHRLRHE